MGSSPGTVVGPETRALRAEAAAEAFAEALRRIAAEQSWAGVLAARVLREFPGWSRG